MYAFVSISRSPSAPRHTTRSIMPISTSLSTTSRARSLAPALPVSRLPPACWAHSSVLAARLASSRSRGSSAFSRFAWSWGAGGTDRTPHADLPLLPFLEVPPHDLRETVSNAGPPHPQVLVI